MNLVGFAIDGQTKSPIVLLRDLSGRRQVPIWIDHTQAHNIMAGIKGAGENVPLTHDLLLSFLKAGNLKVEKIIIDSVEMNKFNALIKLTSIDKVNKGKVKAIEIKARPSDAIALSVRINCRISFDILGVNRRFLTHSPMHKIPMFPKTPPLPKNLNAPKYSH